MSTVIIHTDGASKGNPGDAGIGVVISDQRGRVIGEVSEYIGRATNNVAEYTALIRGLEEARRLGASAVRISTDSELLARQITGRYRVKSPTLRPLHETLMRALSEFGEVSVSHVLRDLNARADRLANDAVRNHRAKDPKHTPPRSDTRQCRLDL